MHKLLSATIHSNNSLQLLHIIIITGPPTHGAGARLVTVVDVCRRRPSSVALPAGGRAGRGSVARGRSGGRHCTALHSGPVRIRPVRATPCYYYYCCYDYNHLLLQLAESNVIRASTYVSCIVRIMTNTVSLQSTPFIS